MKAAPLPGLLKNIIRDKKTIYWAYYYIMGYHYDENLLQFFCASININCFQVNLEIGSASLAV